jgi:hypothetical protein
MPTAALANLRQWLITTLVALVLSLGGYLYTAQAAQIEKLATKQSEHSERIARLEAIAVAQQEILQELRELVRYLSRR